MLPEHVNVKAQSITITKDNAKTRKTRILPITRATAEAIRKLLAARHPAWGPDGQGCTFRTYLREKFVRQFRHALTSPVPQPL